MTTLVDTTERILNNIGLNLPWQRFAVGAILGEIIVVVTKPSFMFDGNGNPRPWSLITEASSASTQPTPIPHFVGALMGGTLLGLFF